MLNNDVSWGYNMSRTFRIYLVFCPNLNNLIRIPSTTMIKSIDFPVIAVVAVFGGWKVGEPWLLRGVSAIYNAQFVK